MNRTQIFSTLRGSHARGLNTPESDLDIIKCYAEPLSFYLGFGGKDAFQENAETDMVEYELRRFVSLLCKSNPNVLEVLWTPDDKFFYKNPVFSILQDNKNLFLSKKIHATFTGYASGQLHRMQTLNSETLNRFEYLESILIQHDVDIKNLVLNQTKRTELVPCDSKQTPLEDILKEYKAIKSVHFRGGRLGDNRKNLIKKYGYDVKNAATCVMLLLQAKEALQHEIICVDQSHNKDLLFAIKKGEVSLEDLLKKVDDLNQKTDKALRLSKLPDDVDYAKAEEVLIKMLKEILRCEFV